MSTLKRLTGNFIYTIGGHFTEALITLVVLGITARYLEPKRFGVFAFALAYVQVFYFLADVGLVRLLVREISRHREQAARYLGAALVSRVFFASVIVPFLLIVIHLITSHPETLTAVYITTLWMVVRLFCTAYVGLFQAFERMEFDSGLTVLAAVSRLGFTYWAIALDAGLSGILYAMVASQVVYLVGAMLIGRLRFCRAHLIKDVALWKFLILQSIPIGASGFFNTMYHQMNTLFLTGFRSTAEVGLYNGPYRIIRQLLFLPLLLMRAPFPIISRLYHISPGSLSIVAEQLFKLSLTLGLPLGAILVFLADEIILFVLGPDFTTGMFVVQYFSGIVAMMFPAMFAAFLLIAMDRQGLVAVIAGACVLINAGLDLLLVPGFGGVGACLATLSATAAMFGVLMSYVWRCLDALSLRRMALEPLGATAVLIGVLSVLKPYGLAIALFIGAVIYIGTVMAMIRFFSRGDLSAFREAIRQI